MIARRSRWKDLLNAPDIELHGVRILSRVSFICIMAISWSANEADQVARAKGLMTFRVEVPAFGLGNHACMQPEAEELPSGPAPGPENAPVPGSG